MATGEKMFSSEGRQVQAPVQFKPLTPGEYDLKLNSDAEVRTAEGEGKLPYVNVSFEALNTAMKEGGKNQRVFHRFFLDTTPTGKGVIMVDQSNGIVAYSKCSGTALEVPLLAKMRMNKETNELEQTHILAPKATAAWLQALEGTVVRARIKTEAGTGGYADKSVIANFVFDAGDEAEVQAPIEEEEEEEVKPAKKNGHSKPAAKPSKKR